MKKKLLAALLCLAWGAPPVLAAKPGSELGEYIVKTGDSCWSIAAKLFGSGNKYKLIHRYNDLGPMPHLLKPGQVLRLPVDSTGPDASVSWIRRDVKAKPPRMHDWLAARKDMALWRLYRVATGDDSAAHIVFEDESDLKLRQQALLVIYGGSARRAARKKRKTKTRVVLEQGTVVGGIREPDAEGSLQVKTKAAQVDLSKAEAQVQVDEAQAALVSVYLGLALVKGRGKQVEVPQDYGTRVEKGKRPETPRKLPARPEWEAELRDLVVLVPPGSPGLFEARWQKARRASRYRIELARDKRFRQVVVDAVVGQGVLRFRAQDLEPGSYYARVSSRDALGLESRPSKRLRVEVAELASSRPLALDAETGYEAVGLLKLTLPAIEGLEMSVDGGDYVPAAPIRLAEPGEHVIRARLAGQPQGSELRVKLLAVRAKLVVTGGPLDVGAAPASVEIEVSDEKGRPAAPPGLTLRAAPGGELPLEATARGRYRAQVPAALAEHREPVRITLAWAAGGLAEQLIEVKNPAPPEPDPAEVAPAFVWPTTPASLHWPRRGRPGPLWAVDPVSSLGAVVTVIEAEHDAAPITRLQLAVQGELSLLDGALGLDAALPVLRPALSRDALQGSMLGDLRLGVRYLVVRTELVRLAPALSLSVPTGGERDGRYDAGFEPGIALEVWPIPELGLSTRQVFALATDFDAVGLAYDATYALVARPLELLGLALEFETLIGADAQDSEYVAAALGGTVLFHFERVRLGLYAGGGLNDDGRTRLGSFAVGARLELGYGGP